MCFFLCVCVCYVLKKQCLFAQEEFYFLTVDEKELVVMVMMAWMVLESLVE